MTVYKILFAKDVKSPNILALIHKLCVKTRVKTTFNDDQDQILIYWKIDANFTTLPSFESDIINLYNEKEDARKFKQLNRDSYYKLIGTNTVTVLSPPELMYLKHQLDEYVNRKKPYNEVELLCKD